MKKVLSIVALAAMTSVFVACGPSAEDKAKEEAAQKRATDSVSNLISTSIENNVEAAAGDSATAAQPTAPAAEEKH